MNKLKLLTIAGTIIAVAAIIGLIYVVAFRNPSADLSSDNVNTNEAPTNEPAKNELPAGIVASNNEYGYSFLYPEKFKHYLTGIYFPHKQERINLNAYKYEIPVEYCSLSGECKPVTKNMEFGSSAVEVTINELKNSSVGELITTRKITNREGLRKDLTIYEISMGAEGEGIVYSFVQWEGGKDLVMFYRTYMDENNLINYKKEKDFIPIAEQERIYEEILKSLP